jgi:thiol-disulfide isomerase/thioredoxin
MIKRRSLLLCISIYALILFLVAGSISCSRANRSFTYTPPSPVPTPVDARANQIQLQMLDGTSPTIQDLFGNNKVVLINFWATWCGPCRDEIPELVELQEAYKDKGLEVIGLSLDEPGQDQEVRAFAKQFSMNYKIGYTSEELLSLFSGSQESALRIPQTYIFGRNGKLLDKREGFGRSFRAWAEGAVNHALNNS